MKVTRSSYYRDLFACGLVGLLTVQGQAATDIAGGMDSGLPGTMVSIPINLSSDASVVGVQLDLGFDAGQLTFMGATAGSVLDPSHIVRDGELEPGVNRVLIYSEANLLVPDGDVLNLNFDIGSMATVGTEMVSLSMVLLADPDAAEVPTDSVTDGDVDVLPDTPAAVVVNRRLFYNNSAFDDSDDSDAIATDKTALLPGETASFANYSSFSKGINGVIVDIQDLADPVGLTPGDFSFFVGNSDDVLNWVQGPDPTGMTVVVGGGMNGSDRVLFEWDDNAIEKEWLEVTVYDTVETGLATPDLFYFGNAVGDTGNSSSNTQVTVSDENAARQNPRNFLDPAPIDFAYDFNRDTFVNISDENIARQNATNFLTDLELLDLSAFPKEGVARASARRRIGDLAFDGGAEQLNPSGEISRERVDDAVGSVAGAIELTIRRDEATGRLVVQVAQDSGLIQLQTTTNLADAKWRNVDPQALVAEDATDSSRTTWIIEPNDSIRLFRAVKEGELVDF